MVSTFLIISTELIFYMGASVSFRFLTVPLEYCFSLEFVFGENFDNVTRMMYMVAEQRVFGESYSNNIFSCATTTILFAFAYR